MLSPAFRRILLGTCASTLYLACAPVTPNTESPITAKSGVTKIADNSTFSPGSKGFGLSPENASESIFRALGGVGLDQSVVKFCNNENIEGDQGNARAVARTYRGYLNKLLSQTNGGNSGNTGSIYGVNPNIIATPRPAETPDPSATTTAPPFPLPTAQDDISLVEKTTFNGKVYDNANKPVDGATVTARSLNSSVPYEAETSTAGGTFAFNNAPAGVQIEITLTQPGYAPRRRVEVLKSNKQGDPNANRYDFGTDGGTTTFGVGYNGASDQPEVIKLSPRRNSVVDSNTPPIVITFSEPMDKASVESNVALCFLKNDPLNPDSSEITHTIADFDVSWNADDSEITLNLKSGKVLEQDKDYHIAFKAGDSLVKDKSGVARSEDHFKLGDGNYENRIKFYVPETFQTQNFKIQQVNFQPLPPAAKLRDDFYFSYDDSSSTASVELFKHAMDNNYLPKPEWSKTWEFLNYENFDHIAQQSTEHVGHTTPGRFKASMGLWKYKHLQNPYLDTYEVGIHLTAPYQCKDSRQNMVLTVLLDVSQSMSEKASQETVEGGVIPSKIELAKKGLKNMASQLKDGDVINIIAFNNTASTKLEGFTVGQDKEEAFAQTINALETTGGTNLQKALTSAYILAQRHFSRLKTNRILFMTDARANEGNVDLGMVRSASGKENGQPIYLSGLGMGFDHDHERMDLITEEGKGSYYAINTQTDIQEAMGNRFIPLMNVIASNVRFNIEFPGFMRHNKSASEELSRNPERVRTTNFSANTSQYFWEQFISNQGDFKGDQTVVLVITYKDPITGQPIIERIEKTLAEMLDKDLQNIKAAHMVNLTAALVRREVSALEATEELSKLIPDVGR